MIVHLTSNFLIKGGKIMGKRYMKILFFLVISLFMVSCAAQQAAQKPLPAFSPYNLNPDVQSGKYVQKANTFLVIADASASMADVHGKAKINKEREIILRMNETIPDIPLTAGLRKFGQNPFPFDKRTELIYGLTKYSKEEFAGAAKNLNWAGGLSPLEGAVNAASDDLDLVEGGIAVIVFSDGLEMNEAPVGAALEMKERYGDKLCIYTVLIGDDKAGKSLLERIAKAGECGFATTADKIASGAGMADFVKRVFFEEAGAMVSLVFPTVLFDTDKYTIKPQYYSQLDEAAAKIKKMAGVKVRIQGHTDSRASMEYNQELSENRAKAVLEYLVKKGVNRGSLSYIGYNFSRPVAPNTTAAGMAQNRRVELGPIR